MWLISRLSLFRWINLLFLRKISFFGCIRSNFLFVLMHAIFVEIIYELEGVNILINNLKRWIPIGFCSLFTLCIY